MSAAEEVPTRTGPPASRKLVAWAVALTLVFALSQARDLLPWAVKFPGGWVLGLREWISGFMKWLVDDLDFGLFTFKDITRSISWLIDQPYWLVRSLLSDGFLKGVGSDAVELFPRISWIAATAIAMLMGLYASGWRLALLVGGCFLYLAVFGQWDSAMVTLSSIAIAVPFGVAGGLALGIWGYRSRRAELAMTPVLDLMQTVPVFAYLVPVLILFGFGPVAAMIATMIYAMPPMVRITMLGLRQVPSEVVEAGRMAGCTPRQLMWKVQIPAAKHSLMVGVNQVVMLSLNMVIIASMIGAGGLGYDVLTALKRLKIGEGIEAGVAITLLAIALDRLSQAYANRTRISRVEENAGLLRRHPFLIVALAIMTLTWAIGAVYPPVQTYPEGLQVTTGSFWGDIVSWINIHFTDQLRAVKNFLLIQMMIPFKRFLLSLPWAGVVGLVALAGWQLGGLRLAVLTGLLAAGIAVVGLWEKAMITVYLCGISVLFASLIGIPIGIVSARNETLHRIVQAIIDTLQTLPSFVYLMPAVMLFRVGDFTAMLAVIAYSVAPAVRYTDHGIRKVPPHLIEAAKTSGCTRRQMLWKVQLPLALPEIVLGINQTIMMALSMLVITALVGTRDLGQEVYIALTKADTGRGIVAGICVAFIAIIADRLIGAWANRRKAELGMT